MAQTIQRELAFLRRKQVETRTGLSRSTICQYIKDGVFPKPVPLGPRAVGWLESDVSEWIAGRVKIARDGSRSMAWRCARMAADGRNERVSAKAIFDIYRFARYIAFIANTDKRADMKQILTHSAQLGQILATRRRASKLSQRTLAAKLAISQNRLSEIETNPGNLTAERLLELANLLGLELVIQDRPSTQRSSRTEW